MATAGVVSEKTERFVVVRVEENKYSVLSLDSTSGKPKQYCVTYNSYRWLCNCPHYLRNCEDVNFACKHIVAVMQTIGQQTEVKKRTKQTNKLEERIEELEMRIEYIEGDIEQINSRINDLEADIAYAINPANFS